LLHWGQPVGLVIVLTVGLRLTVSEDVCFA